MTQPAGARPSSAGSALRLPGPRDDALALAAPGGVEEQALGRSIVCERAPETSATVTRRPGSSRAFRTRRSATPESCCPRKRSRYRHSGTAFQRHHCIAAISAHEDDNNAVIVKCIVRAHNDF